MDPIPDPRELNGELPFDDDPGHVSPQPEVLGDELQGLFDAYIARLDEDRDNAHWFFDQVADRVRGGLVWIQNDSAHDYPEQVKRDLDATLHTVGWCRDAYDRLDALCVAVVGQDPESYKYMAEVAVADWTIVWKDRWRYIEHATKRTFPSDLPAGDVSRTPWEDWGGSIPSLAKWQREHGGASADVYHQHVARARMSAMERMALHQELPAYDEIAPRVMALQETQHTMPTVWRDVQLLQDEFIDVLQSAVVQYMPVTYEGETVPATELYFWDEAARKSLMGVVNRIDKALSGHNGGALERFAKQYVTEQRPTMKQVLNEIADGLARRVMIEELEALRRALRPSAVSPEHVGVSSMGVVTKKRGVTRRAVPAQETEAPEAAVPEHISIGPEIAMWLEGEASGRPVLNVIEGENGCVLVVDCQTATMKEITEKSSCSPEHVKEKLRHMATMIATSKHGKLSGMGVVQNALEIYNYPIWYPKQRSPNAMRVYASQIPVESLAQEVYDELEALNVHSILAYIGTCDKARQIEMLGELTGATRRVIIARGGGSI